MKKLTSALITAMIMSAMTVTLVAVLVPFELELKPFQTKEDLVVKVDKEILIPRGSIGYLAQASGLKIFIFKFKKNLPNKKNKNTLVFLEEPVKTTASASFKEAEFIVAK